MWLELISVALPGAGLRGCSYKLPTFFQCKHTWNELPYKFPSQLIHEFHTVWDLQVPASSTTWQIGSPGRFVAFPLAYILVGIQITGMQTRILWWKIFLISCFENIIEIAHLVFEISGSSCRSSESSSCRSSSCRSSAFDVESSSSYKSKVRFLASVTRCMRKLH